MRNARTASSPSVASNIRSNCALLDRVGQRGEAIEIVERLRDLGCAAMAVTHLSGEPARIGGASAQGARDLLFETADLGCAGRGRVEMIERRIRARFRRGGGEAAFMLGEGVGVERVLARQVLRMDEGLGAGDTGCGTPRAASRASPSPS